MKRKKSKKMFARVIKQTKNASPVKAGSVLVAKPFWKEEAYQRSVILLIQQDAVGSTGIILNKVSNLTVKDALDEIPFSTPLYYGGPMNVKTISYLHDKSAFPDAVNLGNGIYWGGDYEYMKEAVSEKRINPKKMKFFAGFVEWSKGQLESEIAENKWWTTEMNVKELFSTSMEELWMFE